ncbi:hypothetical protein ZHAS_00008275 [Anopheles sinensis]|uniref:Uncharacterized protein n=1 Tax=Anopheles sinensis TaxID=74873 RepID=A0A084VRR5_ANOSI|nr:hypothetical protein ZHAS_00008275 [Anopheles sinensis]
MSSNTRTPPRPLPPHLVQTPVQESTEIAFRASRTRERTTPSYATVCELRRSSNGKRIYGRKNFFKSSRTEAGIKEADDREGFQTPSNPTETGSCAYRPLPDTSLPASGSETDSRANQTTHGIRSKEIAGNKMRTTDQTRWYGGEEPGAATASNGRKRASGAQFKPKNERMENVTKPFSVSIETNPTTRTSNHSSSTFCLHLLRRSNAVLD